MKYKLGDRVKVIIYGGLKGTIIEIRETKSANKYKIHFDNQYLVDAYYSEDELQPFNDNIIEFLNSLLDKLDLISKEVNNIINDIDNRN